MAIKVNLSSVTFGSQGLDLAIQILNLYRYGTLDVPEYFGDHIRSNFSSPTVVFDNGEFFSTGPGQLVQFADFGAVRRAFSGEFDLIEPTLDAIRQLFNLPSNTNTFTGQQLIDSGLLEVSDFRFSFQHVDIDASSSDYLLRTFIFNSQSVQLSTNTTFTFDNGEIRLGNLDLAVRNGTDDFDFVTGGSANIFDLFNGFSLRALGNQLLLENTYDPFRLGEDLDGKDVPIEFEYNGVGRSLSAYDRENFELEQQFTPPRDGNGFDFASRVVFLLLSSPLVMCH